MEPLLKSVILMRILLGLILIFWAVFVLFMYFTPKEDKDELMKNKLNDGFPTDATETAQVRTIVAYFNETQQEYPVLVVAWYSFAYITRQMLPFTGVFAMNLIAGWLYGPIFGYLLCLSLTTLAAALSYLATKLTIHYFLCSNWNTMEEPKPPLAISALVSFQVGDIIAGNQISVALARNVENLNALLKQALILAIIRLFSLIPAWCISATIAAAQFPVIPSILSAFLAALINCIPATRVYEALQNAAPPIYEMEDMHTAIKLIAFAITVAIIGVSQV